MTDDIKIRMVCKACGQEDGRPAEALLRADLVEARREITQLQAENERLNRMVDDTIDYSDLRPEDIGMVRCIVDENRPAKFATWRWLLDG